MCFREINLFSQKLKFRPKFWDNDFLFFYKDQQCSFAFHEMKHVSAVMQYKLTKHLADKISYIINYHKTVSFYLY